ncbi:MAG: GNAT family N-acetyltransferase [Pseudomonadota bacterium]
MIPTLQTERLDLRPPTRADFPAYAAVMQSDRARFMGGPLSLDDAWYDFAGALVGWTLDGRGYWSVWERSTNTLAAFVGFGHSTEDPEPELGWFTTPEGEGRGIAFEAAKAAQAFGIADPDLPTFVSYIDPGNARSIALAKRLGCTLDPDAEPQDEGDLVFRHPATGGQA